MYILLWLSLHAGLKNDSLAVMFSLVIYTIIGLISYFYGLVNVKNGLRLYGGVLIGFVVARLFLIDVWKMEIAGRIITFFFVGVLLVSTAFLGRRRQNKKPLNDINKISEDIKSKSINSLILILVLGFAVTANAQEFPQNPISDKNTDPVAFTSKNMKIISAYRFYKDIDNISIKVPTVVEVPFTTDSIERFNFAILDKATDSFEPYYFKQEVLVSKIPVFVNTFPNVNGVEKIIDENSETYVDLPLSDENTQGKVTITLSGQKAITSSNLTVLLDNHVALPTTVAVRALVNGKDKIIVSKREMRKNTIDFPKTTAKKWQITFTYTQPLRISELRLRQDNATKSETRTVKFLAQPDHSYRIYFDPDRLVKVSVGETGNLSSAQDVLTLTSTSTQSNPEYMIADNDNDGVPDVYDNCVYVSNPDQEDLNNNKRGDMCDDFDKDGIINAKDNCPNKPNRLQADTDGDGIGNVCDKEESRVTERYPWIPWAGIGFAALVLIILMILTAQTSPTSNQENKYEK